MQLRSPTRLPVPKDGKRPPHPVGPPHHWTLLDGAYSCVPIGLPCNCTTPALHFSQRSRAHWRPKFGQPPPLALAALACVGEMVVDDMDVSGEEQRRRYLVYDCMMMAGEGISDLRFQVESRAATSTMQPVLHAHACKGLVRVCHMGCPAVYHAPAQTPSHTMPGFTGSLPLDRQGDCQAKSCRDGLLQASPKPNVRAAVFSSAATDPSPLHYSALAAKTPSLTLTACAESACHLWCRGPD